MKRSALKRSKRPLQKSRRDSIGNLKKQLWNLCKELTRAKYRKPDGTFDCFTCGKLINQDAKAQTGHFIPSAAGGILLRYSLENLRIQDYYCNINLGGNGSSFYKALSEEIGVEKVSALFALKNQTVKADSIWYNNKIAEYTDLLAHLS